MYNASKLIGNISATMEVSYLVGAIETLAQVEDKKFSPFCRKYNPEVPKKVLDYAYNIRSNHFHGGSFEFGEYNVQFNLTSNPKFVENRKNYLLIKRETRKVFINWIKNNFLIK